MPASANRPGHGVPEHVDIVLRHLECPVGAEARLAIGQLTVQHGVPVVMGGGPELSAVADAYDNRPAGEGPEVHADDILLVVA